MGADNTRYLLQAARDRHEATMTRAADALRHLDRTGSPISFRVVAQTAGVSRAWLYRQPALRAEIDRLRTGQADSSPPRPPATQRGSEDSRQRRIEALLEDNARLRTENARLHEQVARLLGERRDRRTNASE
jgi:hypothetical protein